MARYEITIERWAQHMVPQEDVGPLVNTFEVPADGIRHAAEIAQTLSALMMTIPLVWNAPVTKIERLRP